MAHALQFLNHGFRPTSANEEHARAQPADDLLAQFFPCQNFLVQQGVFRLNQTDTTMQLDGYAGGGRLHCDGYSLFRVDGEFEKRAQSFYS